MAEEDQLPVVRFGRTQLGVIIGHSWVRLGFLAVSKAPMRGALETAPRRGQKRRSSFDPVQQTGLEQLLKLLGKIGNRLHFDVVLKECFDFCL